MKRDKITLNRAKKFCTICRASGSRSSEKFFEEFGFHYEEVWDLDVETAKFLLVRIILLRNISCGYPNSFHDKYQLGLIKNPAKAWKEVLDKIIRGLFLYITKDFPTPKEKKIIRKAFRLLFENYESLWD